MGYFEVGDVELPMKGTQIFAGGRMTPLKVLYSLEGRKSPIDDMFSAWADWLVASCEPDHFWTSTNGET